MERSKLLIATNNKGKLGELRGFLAVVPVELLSLSDIGWMDEIEETGATFAENAALKACGSARRAGILTLADDPVVVALVPSLTVFEVRSTPAIVISPPSSLIFDMCVVAVEVMVFAPTTTLLWL